MRARADGERRDGVSGVCAAGRPGHKAERHQNTEEPRAKHMRRLGLRRTTCQRLAPALGQAHAHVSVKHEGRVSGTCERGDYALKERLWLEVLPSRSSQRLPRNATSATRRTHADAKAPLGVGRLLGGEARRGAKDGGRGEGSAATLRDPMTRRPQRRCPFSERCPGTRYRIRTICGSPHLPPKAPRQGDLRRDGGPTASCARGHPHQYRSERSCETSQRARRWDRRV